MGASRPVNKHGKKLCPCLSPAQADAATKGNTDAFQCFPIFIVLSPNLHPTAPFSPSLNKNTMDGDMQNIQIYNSVDSVWDVQFWKKIHFFLKKILFHYKYILITILVKHFNVFLLAHQINK